MVGSTVSCAFELSNEIKVTVHVSVDPVALNVKPVTVDKLISFVLLFAVKIASTAFPLFKARSVNDASAVEELFVAKIILDVPPVVVTVANKLPEEF